VKLGHHANIVVPPKRKYLALMNPFGGGGGVQEKWEQAKKILDKAHIEIVLRETERANHAYEILKNEVQVG